MMFKGIGTGGEQWSGTMTQYCDGPLVAKGASSCPAGSLHVPYPTGGVLAGVWYDNSTASPQTASGNQPGTEALAAAHHFGNTTPTLNRDAYYVILSPHGTNPDSYQGKYCAWHDYNGDTTLTGGAIASTLGHEYSETITDQNPPGGWTNPTTGQENADECAWLKGVVGGAGGVTMGNGSYTEQGSWSNDTNSCALTHPTVS